jgi:hypothetical protein
MPPITDPVVIDLVRRVQARLTPKNYDQFQFCGTACCIAGHLRDVAARHHPNPHVRARASNVRNYAAGTHELAGDLLGLSVGTSGTIPLFASAPDLSWPQPFADEWDAVYEFGEIDSWRERSEKRVDIARRRLDHFLETGE